MINVHLHQPLSAEAVAQGGETWVVMRFAARDRVVLFTRSLKQAEAIAAAVNSPTAANDAEAGAGAASTFQPIGELAEHIVSRLDPAGDAS